MKVLVLLCAILSSSSSAQMCATPMDCYQVEQARRAEAIRLKQEREEAQYRQRQLELQEAQLRELQEQRAVLEEELQEMNESQARIEELQKKELEESRVETKKKKRRPAPTQ